MVALYVEENFVDRTRDIRFGDSGVYESCYDDVGALYRAMQREYGRCTGRVYVDQPNCEPKAVGWVFVKRDKYENSGETYLREVWITVHERKPETKRTNFYKDIGE